jgi:hypothetical protein
VTTAVRASLALIGALSGTASVAVAANGPGSLGERVLVIYNSNEAESKRCADHYAKVRAVPARNVMGIAFSSHDELDWREYTGGMRAAIQARLKDPDILYVVLSHLTPYRMVNSPFPQCWQDWIGLYQVGDADSAQPILRKYTDSAKSGSLSFPTPTRAGVYEYRLFEPGKSTVIKSPPFRVGAGAPFSPPLPASGAAINTLSLIPGGVRWDFDAPTAQYYGAMQGGTVESFIANIFGPDVRVRNPYDQDVVSDSHADDPVPLDINAIPSDTFKPFQPFLDFKNSGGMKYPIYLTFRLDGPDCVHVRAMVDDAIEVERHGGLKGAVTADIGFAVPFIRSLDRPHCDAAGHRPLDWDAYDAVLFAEKAGLPHDIHGHAADDLHVVPLARSEVAYNVTYINSDEQWSRPDLPWNDPRNDNPLHHLNQYAKGAIALRVEFEVKDLRHGNEWIPAQLAAGASVVAGDLFGMFAYANTFGGGAFKDLLQGATVGEAFYRHTQSLGWRNLFIGDPLYRPYPGGRAPYNGR